MLKIGKKGIGVLFSLSCIGISSPICCHTNPIVNLFFFFFRTFMSTVNTLTHHNVVKKSLQISMPSSEMVTNDDYVLLFTDNKILTKDGTNICILPLKEVYANYMCNFDEQDYFYLGEINSKKIYSVFINCDLHEGLFVFQSVRDVLKISDLETAQIVSRAKQLLHWHRASRYSGCCGKPTKLCHDETAKVCSGCEKIAYPSISPVIIVLIEDGKRILLARSPHFAKGMYSTLAGFIESGETCEEAIRREVREEVGVEIKDITYFGSQSWPFPSSLMLGFRAKYEGGNIQIDNKEIEDAQWFDISKLPQLPHECSIARHLIDDYVSKNQSESLMK